MCRMCCILTASRTPAGVPGAEAVTAAAGDGLVSSARLDGDKEAPRCYQLLSKHWLLDHPTPWRLADLETN